MVPIPMSLWGVHYIQMTSNDQCVVDTKGLPLMNSENIYTFNFFDPEPAFIQKSPRQIHAPSELTNHLGEAKTDISSKVQRARAG